MRTSALLLYFMISAPLIYAQKIDSLKVVLPGSSGVQRLDILTELCYEYVDVDNRIAYRYGLQAYPHMKALNDTARIIYSGRYLASALRRLGKADSAILIYDELIPMAVSKRDTAALMSFLFSRGQSFFISGEYDGSLASYVECLNIAMTARDTFFMCSNLNSIGIVYYKLKDYAKGALYFKRCLEQMKGLHDTTFQSFVKLNLSSSYAYLGDYQLAGEYINQVKSDCKQDCNALVLVQASFNWGLINFLSGQDREAEKCFLQSIQLAREIGEIRLQLDDIDYLSQINLRNKNPTKAIQYLKEGERLISDGGEFNLEKIKIYKQFFIAYQQVEDYKNTAFYQHKYIALKDSTYDEALITNLMKTEADYIEKENAAKLRAQAEVLSLREEAIRRQRWVNVLASLIIVAMIITVITLYHSNKQRRAINDRLELKVKERTRELEENQSGLIKACSARDQLIERAVLDLLSIQASIKGLFLVGSYNSTSDGYSSDLLKRIENTSEALGRTVVSLQQSHKA